MYTLENYFRPTYFGNKITAEGRRTEINYSGILTKLIQECGRLCERFASDLFISWEAVMGELKNGTPGTSSWLFGIRESGVDNNTFVLARYENDREYARYKYRKIYRLDIDADGENIKMTLYEVDR